MRLKSEPLRFEWDRTAAAERIEDRRRVAISGVRDLRACCLKHLLVRRAFPSHEFLHHAEQALALSFLLLLRREKVRATRRVVDDRCKENSAARCQWPARPPEVECRRMSMPNRLLPCRFAVDHLQRQRNLDQLLAIRSH